MLVTVPNNLDLGPSRTPPCSYEQACPVGKNPICCDRIQLFFRHERAPARPNGYGGGGGCCGTELDVSNASAGCTRRLEAMDGFQFNAVCAHTQYNIMALPMPSSLTIPCVVGTAKLGH